MNRDPFLSWFMKFSQHNWVVYFIPYIPLNNQGSPFFSGRSPGNCYSHGGQKLGLRRWPWPTNVEIFNVTGLEITWETFISVVLVGWWFQTFIWQMVGNHPWKHTIFENFTKKTIWPKWNPIFNLPMAQLPETEAGDLPIFRNQKSYHFLQIQVRSRTWDKGMPPSSACSAWWWDLEPDKILYSRRASGWILRDRRYTPPENGRT